MLVASPTQPRRSAQEFSRTEQWCSAFDLTVWQAFLGVLAVLPVVPLLGSYRWDAALANREPTLQSLFRDACSCECCKGLSVRSDDPTHCLPPQDKVVLQSLHFSTWLRAELLEEACAARTQWSVWLDLSFPKAWTAYGFSTLW